MTEETQTLTSTTQKTSPFKGLFDNLSHVIDVSRNKFDLTRASNSDKQRWARLLIQGCEVYGKLLETAKIEDIENRLEKIESKTKE